MTAAGPFGREAEFDKFQVNALRELYDIAFNVQKAIAKPIASAPTTDGRYDCC
jgi:hypothetical protein